MPRPMGYQLRPTQPMEVIVMDFLDMPTSHTKWGFKAVLVIVDQLTRVCTCTPTKDKTVVTAAKILIDRWLSFFPDPAFLITDGGTYFKCELFKQGDSRNQGFSSPHTGAIQSVGQRSGTTEQAIPPRRENDFAHPENG